MKIRSVNVEIECVSAKIAQEGEKTYLGHAHTVQPPGYHSKVAGRSIDPGVNAAASNSDLQTSVERRRSETLTWDVLTQCRHCGDLENKSEQLVSLPLNPGCWGSHGMTLRTMGEELHKLQSVQA